MNLFRRLSLLIALAFAVAVPVAQAQDASGDLAKLQGTWVLRAGSKDGKPLTGDELTNSKIVFKGNKVEVQTKHQSSDTIRATVKLGKEGSVRTMEWVRENGPDAGKTMLAIYEMRGSDEYVVVFAPAGKERPKAFSTKRGSGHIMHVWKRAKA